MNGATLNRNTALAAVAAGATLVAAGCGSSTKTESTPAAPASTGASTAPAAAGGASVSAVRTSLGTILVAGPKHLTVYRFEADKGTTSTCSGACASLWPPVAAPSSGTPQVSGGLSAALVGTTTRSDGSKQITYAGHPLYYFAADSEQGQTKGQGINSFGAHWYVLGASGAAIKSAASSSSSEGEGGGYRY
jgi:predicted lipoprotein with Yx(FWY)xxD motif